MIGHWEREVKSKVKNDTLRVLVYHGQNREIAARKIAKYDLVVTTYGTVQSEVSKVLPESDGKKSVRLDDLKPLNLDNIDVKNAVLLNVIWERIILDEAHVIRNPTAKTSTAICRLRAAKRWAVTGKNHCQNAPKNFRNSQDIELFVKKNTSRNAEAADLFIVWRTQAKNLSSFWLAYPISMNPKEQCAV